MTTHDMSDEETQIEQRRLAAKLETFLRQPMNGRTVEKIEEMVKDHRNKARLRGLKFPDLAVIVLPTLGNIEVVPRDLTQQDIETLIVNLARKWPAVSAAELGFAINRAFPGYAKMVDAAAKSKGWQPH